MPQDAFISYSRCDLHFVERLNEFLLGLGVTTWFDRQALLPGDKWQDVINDEIPRSKTFLTCLSKAGMDRPGYFHVEQHLSLEAALRVPPERLFILPVLLGECDIPRQISKYHAVNLVELGAIEKLVASLSSALDRDLTHDPVTVSIVRESLLAHLDAEGASNRDFVIRQKQEFRIRRSGRGWHGTNNEDKTQHRSSLGQIPQIAHEFEKLARALLTSVERLSVRVAAGTENDNEGLGIQSSIMDAAWNLRAKNQELLDEPRISLGRATEVRDPVGTVYEIVASNLNQKVFELHKLRSAISELREARRHLDG